MKKERTIKELLQLMLNNQQLFHGGLCLWASELYWNKLISDDERWILNDYIDKNRPLKYSSFSAYINRNSIRYWKVCNIKPRIKWLNKHIAKL